MPLSVANVYNKDGVRSENWHLAPPRIGWPSFGQAAEQLLATQKYTPNSHMSSSKLPAPSMNPHVRRHRQFYIRTGNLHFLVGRYLFRVHQHFFTTESEYFRDLLETTYPLKGTDDGNAVVLDDVTVEEFECFLAVFYEPQYTLNSSEEWLLILELANHWRFGEVKKTAVRALNKLVVPEVDRIVAFQNHGVSNPYILPLFAALVARDDPLSAEEGEKLGMRTAIHVAQLRETARSNMRRARGEPALESRRVQANVAGIVQETFNIPAPAPT